MITKTVFRDHAVADLADEIKKREHFVVIAPFDDTFGVASILLGVPGAHCYVDNGTDLVLRVDEPAVLSVIGALTPDLAIVAATVVPKSQTTVREVTEMAGGEVPADLRPEQDLIFGFRPDAEVTIWPRLFIAALDIVDPKAAAMIRGLANVAHPN